MNDKIHLNLSYHLGNSKDFRSSVLEKETKIKYILLQIAMCLVAQLCPILCDPKDCSPPVSSVVGILQARILEWVAMPSSRETSQPRDGTQVSQIAGGFFTV